MRMIGVHSIHLRYQPGYVDPLITPHDVVNICRIVFIADVQEDLSEGINTNEKMIRE